MSSFEPPPPPPPPPLPPQPGGFDPLPSIEREPAFDPGPMRPGRPTVQTGPLVGGIVAALVVVGIVALVVSNGSDDTDTAGTSASIDNSVSVSSTEAPIDTTIVTETTAAGGLTSNAPTTTEVPSPFSKSFTLTGHSDDVLSVDFSSDGSKLVSASKDGTVRIWDVNSRRQLKVLRGHNGLVYGATFSHDGTRVVSAGADGTVRIWDVASGVDMFGPLRFGDSLTSHDDGVTWAEFSPYDDVIASSGLDGKVVLWDTMTGELVWATELGTAELGSVSWDPRGDRIVVCDENGRLVVTTLFDEYHSIDGWVHSTFITSAVFNAAGTRILTASKDNTLKVFDATSGAEVATMVGHSNWVLTGAFSPDGQLAYSASQDGTARIWDANTGEELWSLGSLQPGAAPINGIDASPLGNMVAVGDDNGNVVLWYA